MDINNYIKDIKDFPIKGVTFKDISPLLDNPDAFKYTVDLLSEKLKSVDKIVALDARGFIFGGAIAFKLGIPLVLVRKIGKLPGKTISIKYKLEYGENEFEVLSNSIKKGDKIGIIDDLLATGGTAKASIDLVEKLGGIVDSVNFVINLKFLNGEENLKGYKINSLLEY